MIGVMKQLIILINKEELIMTKDQIIGKVNSILTEQFDFIPLYKVICIVNELIEKEVIKVEDELKED
jgi:hypothetical protein